MDNFYKFTNFINATLDVMDNEIEILGNECLPFFTMCIDEIKINEIFSAFSGDVFYYYEEDEEEYDDECNNNEIKNTEPNKDNQYFEITYLTEIKNMRNEDININKIKVIEFEDIEMINYSHVDDYIQNSNHEDLDEKLILHNLKSINNVVNINELWVYKNKLDMSNNFYTTRWLMGQSAEKIIDCIILTINSAINKKMYENPQTCNELIGSLKIIDILIKMYPTNEKIINLRTSIKSKI